VYLRAAPRPDARRDPYVATKGALQQLTASLAKWFAPQHVTVNCIDPGPVDTGYADQDLLRRGNQGIALGRWGRPQDTANLVEWVVGDAGGWVTGQTLVSDGGSSSAGRDPVAGHGANQQVLHPLHPSAHVLSPSPLNRTGAEVTRAI
jgi:NAD(P)-dependent dehydrogenase (short-subunit alcohol dehydrogenase family)